MLCLLIVLSALSGCSDSSSGDSGIKRYGDADSKNALRICFDIAHMYSDDPTHYDYLDSFNPTGFSGMFNDFIAAVKASTGIESVAIEYLPYGGAERETALSRMRTEIMAGGGPDVFVVLCTSFNDIINRSLHE